MNTDSTPKHIFTKQQINKVAKMLGLTKDLHEEQEFWESRVREAVDYSWERLGELERETATLLRKLRNVHKVLVG